MNRFIVVLGWAMLSYAGPASAVVVIEPAAASAGRIAGTAAQPAMVAARQSDDQVAAIVMLALGLGFALLIRGAARQPRSVSV